MMNIDVNKFLSRKLGVVILLSVLLFQMPDFEQNCVLYAKIAAMVILGVVYMIVNCIQNIAHIFHLDKPPNNGNGEELKKVGGSAVGNTPTQ